MHKILHCINILTSSHQSAEVTLTINDLNILLRQSSVSFVYRLKTQLTITKETDTFIEFGKND